MHRFRKPIFQSQGSLVRGDIGDRSIRRARRLLRRLLVFENKFDDGVPGDSAEKRDGTCVRAIGAVRGMRSNGLCLGTAVIEPET
jgi:hypothetical protein